MPIARWLTNLALSLPTLLAGEAIAGQLQMCDDWPNALVRHELGVEVKRGQVDTQVKRIRSACEEHPEFSCSVISKAVETQSDSGVGKLSLRLSADSVDAFSKMAAANGRVTGQIVHQDDPQQATALSALIALKSLNHARIKELLVRSDLTDEQKAVLHQELMFSTRQIASLSAAQNGLRPRKDSDSLYVEVTSAP